MKGKNTLTLNRASLEEAFADYIAKNFFGVEAKNVSVFAIRNQPQAGGVEIDFEITKPKAPQS